MDPYSDGSEAAMRLVGIDYGMTLDEMLCSPQAASEFDQLAGLFAPGYSSFEYRWSALALRKRAGTKRYRTLATDQHEHWKQQRTPMRLTIDKGLVAKYDCPGVYVVLHEDSVLYVGETRSIRDRVERLLNTEAWMNFAPTAVRVWPLDGEQQQFGLRSFLINRDKPLLNSEYLRQS